MSQSVGTIAYASPQMHTCPLCRKRPVAGGKTIYGHAVCKKCFYAFANRRQLGYLVDAILVTVVNVGLALATVPMFERAGVTEPALSLLMLAVNAPVMLLFIMKDGFGGASPGKRLCGVRVLDDPTNQPIGFGQSFKRNSPLLVGLIPFAGGFASLIVIIIIAIQLNRGYRLGDGFARTRVIWKKFAHLPVFGGDALVCEHCGYELHGNTSGVCPECGTPVSELNRQRLESSPTPQMQPG